MHDADRDESQGAGEDHNLREFCDAKKRSVPGRCRHPAGWGTSHPGYGCCKMHGGNMPMQVRHNADVKVEHQTRLILRREDLVPLTDPLPQLQRLAAEVVRMKDILGDQVEGLNTLTRLDITEKEEMRAVILAYERALDRCHKVLSDMVRLDIDERLLKLDQAKVAMLMQVVNAVIESKELGLDSGQRDLARSLMSREVITVSASAA